MKSDAQQSILGSISPEPEPWWISNATNIFKPSLWSCLFEDNHELKEIIVAHFPSRRQLRKGVLTFQISLQDPLLGSSVDREGRKWTYFYERVWLTVLDMFWQSQPSYIHKFILMNALLCLPCFAELSRPERPPLSLVCLCDVPGYNHTFYPFSYPKKVRLSTVLL